MASSPSSDGKVENESDHASAIPTCLHGIGQDVFTLTCMEVYSDIFFCKLVRLLLNYFYEDGDF